MIDSLWFSGFQGWIQLIFGSVWTYLVLAFIFGVLCIIMVFRLRDRNKAKKTLSDSDRIQNCDGSNLCEDKLLKSIESLYGKPNTILLAAAGLECLPVTVPIRIALAASENKKRCLLIDLDTRRDAVWKAFDLESQHTSSVFLPTPSGVENLSVLPAHFFQQNKVMNIRTIAENAQKNFDLILINAPYLDGHPDRNLISSCAEYAFVFAQETSQIQRLGKLCTTGHCKVLASYKVKTNGSPTSSAQ